MLEIKNSLNTIMHLVDVHFNVKLEGWFVYRMCLTCRKKLTRCKCTRMQRNIFKSYHRKTEIKWYSELELSDLITIIDKNIVISIDFLTSFSYSKYKEQVNIGIKYPNVTCYHYLQRNCFYIVHLYVYGVHICLVV